MFARALPLRLLLVSQPPLIPEVRLCQGRTLDVLGSSAAPAAPATRRGLVRADAEARGESGRLDRGNCGPDPERDQANSGGLARAGAPRPGPWLQAQARIPFLP